MNIVQVARRFVRQEWGGTETAILETSKCLLKKGHRTEIVSSNALAPNDHERIQGVEITRTPYFYPYWGLQSGRCKQLDKKGGNLFSFALMKLLARQAPLDLLHAHTGKRLGGIVRHIARKRKLPYVVSLHGGVHDVPAAEAATWTEPTRGALEWGKVLGWWVGSRRVLEDADAIICVGRREQELTQKKFPDKYVAYLPNGVDCDRFASGNGQRFRNGFSIAPDAQVITVVGRFDVQKNQLLALHAFAELASQRPELHLVLVGHVTNQLYLRELKEQTEALNLTRRVTIVPGLDPATDLLVDAYHAADVFLLPSNHEPFGIAILEAWAAGVPVVAASVGGVRSLVDHGSDGLLFEAGDQQGAVRSIELLLDNADARRELADAGRRKAVEQYSWQTVTERLIAIYQEVLR